MGSRVLWRTFAGPLSSHDCEPWTLVWLCPRPGWTQLATSHTSWFLSCACGPPVSPPAPLPARHVFSSDSVCLKVSSGAPRFPSTRALWAFS